MKVTQWITSLFSDSKTEDTKNRQIFFELLRQNNGSITVIDFAMAADLSGTDAKKLLEQYAVEFDATFDVTEAGNILYLFPLGNKSDALKNSPVSDTKAVEATRQSVDFNQERKSNSPQLTETPKNTQGSRETAQTPQNVKPSHTQSINRKVQQINQEVQQKKNDIKQIENGLEELGKSLNDLFKF